MIGREICVRLESHEVALAAQVGIRRQLEALARNLPDKHGYQGDGWSIHIHGAGGELAFAKAAGMYWNGSVNTFKAPDLAGNIQVRTRSGVGGREDLIVRPGDASSDVFVLVVGQVPEFVVAGWCYGSQAKQKRFAQNYGDRPSAYFVPRKQLIAFPIEPGIRPAELVA